MTFTEATRLSDLDKCPVRPLNQAEAKSALSDLKDIARERPEVAAVLSSGGVLKDFIVAALSLSPYLRDTVRVAPELLARDAGLGTAGAAQHRHVMACGSGLLLRCDGEGIPQAPSNSSHSPTMSRK